MLARDIALWAATIMSSRSFTSSLLSDAISHLPHAESLNNLIKEDDSFPVLFPVIDLLNHQSRSNMQWTRGKYALSLDSGLELQPGQAIWNNYGPKGNEERKSLSISPSNTLSDSRHAQSF